MGTSSSKTTDDIPELIEKYESRVKRIEESTIDFMNYVDVLQTSARHFEGQSSSSVDLDERIPLEEISAMQLLCRSKASAVAQKQFFLKEFVEFIEFIAKVISPQSSHSEYRLTFEELKQYMKTLNEKQVMVSLENYKLYFKMMDMTAVKDEICDLEAQIDVLKRENKNLHDENENLNLSIKTHDCQIENEKSVHKIETDKLKTNISEMEKEIKKFQERTSHTETQEYQMKQQNTEIKTLKSKLNELIDTNTRENMEKNSTVQTLTIEIQSMKEKLQSAERATETKEKELLVANGTINAKEDELSRANRTITIKEEKMLTAERAIKSMEVELSRANRTIQIKEEKLFTAERAIKTKEEELSGANRTIQIKEEKLLTAERAIKTKEDELFHANRTIQIKEEKLLTAERAIKTKEDELFHANRTIKTKEEKLLTADKIYETKEDELLIANRKIEHLNEVSKDLNNKNQTLSNELQSANSDINELKNYLSKSELNLNETIAECDAAIEKQKNEHESVIRYKNSQLQKLENSVQTTERQLQQREKTLGRKISAMENEKAILSGRINELEQEVREARNREMDLKKGLEACTMKIDALERKLIMKVKLFCLRRVNFMSDFENDLMAVLKSKIDEENKELKFEQCAGPEDVDADRYPTIVLCFTASRIGTDAANAVQGLNLSPKMALLMIHHKDVHALPQQSSKLVLTGQEFKKLGCISDMAFLKEKGIFSCEINNNSIVKLVSFIRKESVVERKY